MKTITVGLDLAKHWFRFTGSALLERSSSSEGFAARKLSRSFAVKNLPRRHGGPREGALLGTRTDRVGHEVRLMPPAYVRVYFERNKNDATDAAGDLRGGDADLYRVPLCASASVS
jgi:transposase